jgi:peptidoglycan hydrolase CwlO-like protein
MTVTELWEKFKGFPIWKKFLLGLPLLVIILALGCVYVFKNISPVNQEIIDNSKEKTDNEVVELKDTLHKLDKKIKKIDNKKKELEGQSNEIHKEHVELSNSIDNASDVDELVGIAEALRSAAKNRKRKV